MLPDHLQVFAFLTNLLTLKGAVRREQSLVAHAHELMPELSAFLLTKFSFNKI